MLSQIFTIEDTALYTTWHLEDGGIVSILVPGIGEIRMTLEKAEELSKDLARQAEYGRWAKIEKQHDVTQELAERMSPDPNRRKNLWYNEME